MKRIFILLLLVLVGFIIYRFYFKSGNSNVQDEKLAAITLKKHSETFNSGVDSLMGAYHAIKTGLVNADTGLVKLETNRFLGLLDRLPLQELKKDTAMIFETATASVQDIKANAESLVQQGSLDEMRKDFSMITEMMYPGFFRTINYEGPNLYLQHCPMAFGDDNGANWISDNQEILNPYLGRNHPKYKGTMLHCGEIMDTIKAQ